MSEQVLGLGIGPSARAALALLLGRYHCAAALGRPAQNLATGWSFLGEMTGLDAAGLRSLLEAGLVEHWEGVPGPWTRQHQLRPAGFRAGPRSSFTLSPSGVALAWGLFCPVASACGQPASPDEGRPCWRASDRTLSFREEVVLAFCRSAPNQECVLDALEELSWPPRLDDPLPHKAAKGRRKRLGDTLRSLSAAQGAIHFRVSADGRGVLWSANGGG
jgi:hypothetical protein